MVHPEVPSLSTYKGLRKLGIGMMIFSVVSVMRCNIGLSLNNA